MHCARVDNVTLLSWLEQSSTDRNNSRNYDGQVRGYRGHDGAGTAFREVAPAIRNLHL
ncbi:uncharacterized protein CC84DRAFT_1159755 [Paraphaeosphaeria sporulosa]|uniref:Uncharacterized protein n=1 Tax=Paraphaeosphaeria sporulosa TaxID=1460663 RepID=A0A177CZT8_9PLEO|nr:uncharacterized protein CC84DRAFT_1159755 [Paraphaeosphaeria sporulosa]OAG12432.1 hypothetical protein CC84DRAFT_1159755 [Paraphaeosphaeria sporulosa]